jgi:hypothetical protein
LPAAWALFAASALAGVRPIREPLPARAVERPVVTPEGWTEVLADVGAAGVDSSIRYGVARRWDVGLAQQWRADGLDVASLESRFALIGREPPVTSLALSLGWEAPVTGPQTPAGRAGLAFRQGLGPFQLELQGGWRQPVDRVGQPTGAAILRLQAGPLVFSGEGASSGAWPPDGAADCVLQVTRAVSIGGGAVFPADGAVSAVARGSLWW